MGSPVTRGQLFFLSPPPLICLVLLWHRRRCVVRRLDCRVVVPEICHMPHRYADRGHHLWWSFIFVGGRVDCLRKVPDFVQTSNVSVRSGPVKARRRRISSRANGLENASGNTLFLVWCISVLEWACSSCDGKLNLACVCLIA